MKKLLLTTALCCAAMTTLAATQQVETFTSNQKPIHVLQNQTFDIKLQSNPSTGFSWKLTSYQKPLVTFVGQKYTAPGNQKPSVSVGAKTREATKPLLGAPGYETFTFQAKEGKYRVNQVGHIVLTYARPWTKDGASKKTFIVVVSTKSEK